MFAFTAAAGVLTITPGLDTALVLRTAAVEGARRAMLAGLGICVGCLVWGLGASVGLGALLATSKLAYDVLRLVAACYLIFLGGKLLLRPRATASHAASSGTGTSAAELQAPPDTPASRWFARGLFTNILNPKVGVFYATFLPLFIPAGVNVTAFSMLLATIHAVEGILWFALLASATRPLARWLARPGVVAALDRATGGVLVGFGLRLAFERSR